MPEYQNFNWFTVMRKINSARTIGSSTGLFKLGDSIHKIDIKLSSLKTYDVTINEIPMGSLDNMGEAWDSISLTLNEDNNNS